MALDVSYFFGHSAKSRLNQYRCMGVIKTFNFYHTSISISCTTFWLNHLNLVLLAESVKPLCLYVLPYYLVQEWNKPTQLSPCNFVCILVIPSIQPSNFFDKTIQPINGAHVVGKLSVAPHGSAIRTEI